jgi:pilus assembly protein Flp/PilA
MIRKIGKRLALLWGSDEGLTTVEYAVAGTLITLAVIVAFTALGGAVSTQIQAIVTALTGCAWALWGAACPAKGPTPKSRPAPKVRAIGRGSAGILFI